MPVRALIPAFFYFKLLSPTSLQKALSCFFQILIMPQEEIHITDMACELGTKIMIRLSSAMTRKLFDSSSRGLSEILSRAAKSCTRPISPSLVRAWRARKRPKPARIPLWVTCELGRIRGLSPDYLERNVIALSFKRGREIVTPKLPLTVDPVFDSVLIHFYGDGNPSNCRFVQLNEERRKLFIRKIEHIFGKLPTKETCNGVNLPKFVFEIYRWKYEVNFQERRVPNPIYRKNWKHKLACIEAFLLDEGTIDGNSVSFRNTDPLFLKDIRELCIAIGYECSKVSKMGHRANKEVLGFYILSESIPKLYEDVAALEKEFPTLHLGTKQLYLKNLVEILTSHGKRFSLTRSILSILENGPQTTYELSCAAKARHSVILNAMKRLESKRIVHRTRKTEQVTVWELSDFYNNMSAKQKRVIDLSRKNKQVLMYLTINGLVTREILAGGLGINRSNLYENLNLLIQLKLIAKEFDSSGTAWYSSIIGPSEVLHVLNNNKGGGD